MSKKFLVYSQDAEKILEKSQINQLTHKQPIKKMIKKTQLMTKLMLIQQKQLMQKLMKINSSTHS